MQENKNEKIIANWVMLGVVMLLIQVLLGGATRLTGSGLSITDWKPLLGTIPPMTEKEWQENFLQYQQIGQFKFINNSFTLSNYKFIFFWEWFHRLWARLIAVAFAVPFVYFLYKKYFSKWMIMPLLALFILGGLQGAIGWIMVKSGLNIESVYVSHIKLSIHFITAMLLIVYAFVFALHIYIPKHQKINNKKLRQQMLVIVAVVTFQLLYGAFMAGLKAANVAPTFPDINGSFLPDALFQNKLKEVLFFNPICIQFIHRLLAFIILFLMIFWFIKSKKIIAENKATQRFLQAPIYLVVLQILLGIIAILSSPKIVLGKFGLFEYIALTHQFVGMLLLLSAVGCVFVLGKKE